jgi:hypothetical protein
MKSGSEYCAKVGKPLELRGRFARKVTITDGDFFCPSEEWGESPYRSGE